MVFDCVGVKHAVCIFSTAAEMLVLQAVVANSASLAQRRLYVIEYLGLKGTCRVEV